MTMTMNSTQNEAVRALLEWAKEDEDNRSLLIIAEEEDRHRSAYNGTELTLVTSLVVAMHKDDILRQVCAKAMMLLEKYEASITNKQDDDEAETK